MPTFKHEGISRNQGTFNKNVILYFVFQNQEKYCIYLKALLNRKEWVNVN